MRKIYLAPKTTIVQMACETIMSISNDDVMLEVDNESTDDISGDSNVNRWADLW